MDLTKLSHTKKEEIALRICQEIEASDTAKGTLPRRWQVNEDIYHVAPGVTTLSLFDDMEGYNIPLWRQKADRIKGSVVAAITGLYPYVQCIQEGADAENEETLERDLMTLATHAQFDVLYSEAVLDALNTNNGVLRMRPVDKRPGMTCPVIDYIHPKNLAVYPAQYGTYEDAKTIGHRFYKLLYQVKEQIRKGEYMEVPDLCGGDDPRQDEMQETGQSLIDKTQSDSPVSQESTFVRLWEVITTIDLGDGYKRYLCVVADRQRALLSIEEYEYEEIWYFNFNTAREGGKIWKSDSVAQTVQGPQKAFSDIWTTILQGSMVSCAPPVVMAGGSPVMGKAKRYSISQIWETDDANMKFFSIPITFDPGKLEAAAAKLEEIVDALTGINRLGTGQELPASTKATAIDALMAMQAEAKDNYTAAMTPSIERMWKFLAEMYRMHFMGMKAYFGKKLEMNSPSEIPENVRFEATGKSQASSPQQLLAKLQVAAGIAADPTSEYDARKIQNYTMQALDFPFSVNGMKKDWVTAVLKLMAILEQMGIAPEAQIQVLTQAFMPQDVGGADAAIGGGIGNQVPNPGEGGSVLQNNPMGVSSQMPSGNGSGGNGQVQLGGGLPGGM